MAIYYNFSDLPVKIRGSAATAKIISGKLLLLFKTTFKPSHSIPIVWFLMYTDGLMFRTTGAKSIFKEILKTDINCIRIHNYGTNENVIEIIYNDLSADSDYLTIPKQIDVFELENNLKANSINVTNNIKR